MPKAVVVLGVDDLKRSLEELGKQVRTKLIRRALYAGGVVIREKARAELTRNGSIDSGLLRKQLAVETQRVKKKDTMVVKVRPRKGEFVAIRLKSGRERLVRTTTKAGKAELARAAAASIKPRQVHPRRYAHLVEFGSKPHLIPRSKKNPDLGKIEHPGAKPKPFLKPAWDAGKNEALRVLAEKARTDLPGAIKESKKKR